LTDIGLHYPHTHTHAQSPEGGGEKERVREREVKSEQLKKHMVFRRWRHLEDLSGFKVKGNLKRRCKDCYIVVRQERGYVICPTHPRHKQMSMKKRDYKSWILTHATQSKERGF